MATAQREKAIDRLMIDVTQAFGERLVSLALYGSAVSADFVPKQSDLNFAIIIDRVTLSDLKTLQRLLPGWHRLGVATPLLVDLDFLQHAGDVFPIELEDMRSRHRLLAGKDVLAEVHVNGADLRRQLEQEARGKLLRLRVQYAETGGKTKEIEALMVASLTSLLVIVRGVLSLRPGVVPTTSAALLDRFESEMAQPFAAIRQVLSVKLGEGGWKGGADAAFAEYLGDVERLVTLVDRLQVDSEPASAEPG